MKKPLIIINALALVMLGLFLFTASTVQQAGNDDPEYREAFRRNYKMFAVDVPDKLDFAGEQVPVHQFHVRESLDRELLVNSYWHSNTILLFKRAYRWFPVIRPILAENSIPEDFFFLCMIESGLENVVSPAGAAGYWQFMKNTGISYGLEITADIDERYHVEKATRAACKYLKAAYARFGNWTLAAASYNMGMEGLAGTISSQRTSNYYDLMLNRETLRYVYRILAVKTIFKNPVHYGFYLRKKDLYPVIPVRSTSIDSSITDVAAWCASQKVSYRVFKELNPWILKNSLPAKDGKSYELLLPAEGWDRYHELLSPAAADQQLFNDTLKVKDIR